MVHLRAVRGLKIDYSGERTSTLLREATLVVDMSCFWANTRSKQSGIPVYSFSRKALVSTDSEC